MAVLSWIWKILKAVLNSIARAVVFTLILVGVLVGVGVAAGDGLSNSMVLELDLRKGLPDKAAPQLLDFGRQALSIMDVVLALDAALEIEDAADALDVGPGPVGDLLILSDAERIELLLDQHADTANALEIVDVAGTANASASAVDERLRAHGAQVGEIAGGRAGSHGRSR